MLSLPIVLCVKKQDLLSTLLWCFFYSKTQCYNDVHVLKHTIFDSLKKYVDNMWDNWNWHPDQIFSSLTFSTVKSKESRQFILKRNLLLFLLPLLKDGFSRWRSTTVIALTTFRVLSLRCCPLFLCLSFHLLSQAFIPSFKLFIFRKKIWNFFCSVAKVKSFWVIPICTTIC